MTSTISPRRLVTALLAVMVGAVLLITVPMPTVVEAKTYRSAVRTERLAMGLHRGLGKSAQLAAATAAEPEVQHALAAPVRRGATASAPFDALGITVATAPTEPILVRGRVDGRWTAWTEADFVPDEAPDRSAEPTRPGAHSAPIWFGDADAYQVDAPAGLAAVSVHLVSDEVTGTTRRLAVETAGALGVPAIASRASWGARSPKVAPTVSDDLKVAIVHHSVNANTYSAAQVPALLRSIQAYHQDVQGWDDIAYNFAVDRFGKVWEARAGGIDKVVLGGHSQGFNTGTVGVVVLGDFTAVKAPAAAVESVSRVIAWKFAINRVDPSTTVPYTTPGSGRFPAGTTVQLRRIVGHRDVQTTSCPGNGLYSQLGSIRARVAQLVPQYQAGLPSRLVGLDLSGDGLQDAVEQRLGPTGDTAWTATGVGTFARSARSITGPYRPVTGDFDGDGRDDLLWHGSGSSPDYLWWSGSPGQQQRLDVMGSYVLAAGDFDGDGRDDILWYAPGIAMDTIWYGRGDRRFAQTKVVQDLIGGVPVVGDFDGDGRDDVFWYGRGASSDAIWWSNGRTWTPQKATVNGLYTVVGVRDGSTGRDRLLFVPPSGTASYRWELDRSGVTSGGLGLAGLLAQPTVGDFDGDGNQDVLLLARDTRSTIWFSSDTAVVARPVTTPSGASAVSGRMDDASPRDELLLVSTTAPDELWRVGTDRSIARIRVG